MLNWDYALPPEWKPHTDEEWIWYLNRVMNYGLSKGERLDPEMVRKYLPKLTIEQKTRDFMTLLLAENDHELTN